ncbi:hypothetical protein [Microbispora sp. CA-102843]|uniref:hypothetical protein n=1 Tax=Microbispora sp. CA-102843 TaxID=3239952 RepID=UPI003D8D42D8
MPEPGGRGFCLWCNQEIGEGSEPHYVADGGWWDITPDFWDEAMGAGAHLVGSSDIAQEMNLFLAEMAFRTERFIDETWFSTPGLLCRVPAGAWA